MHSFIILLGGLRVHSNVLTGFVVPGYLLGQIARRRILKKKDPSTAMQTRTFPNQMPVGLRLDLDPTMLEVFPLLCLVIFARCGNYVSLGHVTCCNLFIRYYNG